MNDEELQKLVEIADRELHAVYEAWIAKLRESKLMADFIFTEEERKAWREREPDYPKLIVH
ncbi:MAG TPA: hypothetical protein VK503_08300 [Candidatus Bathyarchaeia archaeon]|nr:hypothetical protein [Candidatus Bathyarchaeia archaeon]